VDAEYVFRVTFRIEPTDPDVSVDPETFETVLRKRAARPGEPDWRFFRDNLWRGAVNDEEYLRELAGTALGVEVVSVAFSELRTDEAYLSALREAIADDLGSFRAEDVGEVLHKYLGSSVRVEEARSE
jgi:hypothetical protein